MLNDLKKLLFGAKSVAKSAANKAKETGKEVGEDLIEKSGDFIEKASDKAGEYYDKASDKARDLYDKAKDEVDDFTDKFWKDTAEEAKAEDKKQPESNFTEASTSYGDSIFDELEDQTGKKQPRSEMPEEEDKPDDFVSKTGERVLKTAEELGEKLREESSKAGEKFKEIAEDVGEKVLKTGGEAFDRAKEAGSKLWDKASEKAKDLYDKAQTEAEKDALEEKIKEAEALRQRAEDQTKAADKSEGSTLGGFDSFFDKAKRFAEGDYHGTGSKKSETSDDKLELTNLPDDQKPKKKSGTVPGFEDLDGDGDEIIDDAIIDDDDDK